MLLKIDLTYYIQITPASFYQEVIFRNLLSEINTELELMSEWFKANKLTLNIDKTYYMVFHRGRRKFKT